MHPDFIRLAHRRSIWAEIQRLIVDRYIQQGEQPPREQIICEDVPFAKKEVTQEALYEVLCMLEESQDSERCQMSQFEMKRKDVPQAKRQETKSEEAAPSTTDESKQ